MEPHLHTLEARARYAAALLFVACLLSSRVPAEHNQRPGLLPDVPFGEYLQRHFYVRDGLPSNWIYDVVQTRDDYVWIATHNGVVRYDGLRFRLFNRSNSPHLPANDTRVLYESRDGSLWIGTVGGLARYAGSGPDTIEEFETFAGNSVHAIFEDHAGTLWLGTREETWAKAQGRHFEVVDGAPVDVKAICEDQHGVLWFGSDSGLYTRRGTKYERVAHDRLPIPTESDADVQRAGVHVLLADDDGGVWIGAHRGLLYIKDGRFERRGQEIGQQQVYGMMQSRNGRLYLATRFGLQHSVDDGKFTKLPSEEFTRCITEDREGGLWVGHGGNRGLHYYRRGETSAVLKDHRVNCVHEDREGNMWFGSDSGLHRLCQEQIKDFDVSDGLPDVRVQTMAPGTDNGFWIGTRNGLARWSGSELSIVETPPILAHLNIASAFEDTSGVLWIALGNRGGYALRNGELRKLPALDHGNIRWFYEDHGGQLWIGHEYGLFRSRNGQITRITDPAFDRLNNSHFVCHHAAEDGTLWMGTSGGIVRYQEGRFAAITSEDGLAADYVDRMVADSHGNLWLGGRDGFFFVRMSELEQVAAGRLQKLTSHRVRQIEGVPVSGFFPKGRLATDGTMWLAGRRGVIRLPSKSLLKDPLPSSVHIEQVRVDGKKFNGVDNVELLSGRHRLAIDFAAPTFANPQAVQVKFRLDGHDNDWIDAGDERVAYYTDLRPGRYAFRVRAGNRDGHWLESDETLAIAVKPRWWETTWFRTSAACGLIGLMICSAWGYSHRVRQRNALLHREVDERKRVEESLRRSETRFRTLAESTRAIPFEADVSSLQFTFVGQQAVKVLGYPINDWLEEDFWIGHLHPEDRLASVEFCKKAAASGGSHQFESRLLAADGTTVWLHNVFHVTAEAGAATKLIGFMVDVTERHQAEEKARDYLQQLARVNRVSSMGEMASSIAHEVNQPLFAIVSNAQTAKRLLDREHPDVAEVREALNDIVSDGNRASTIIDHVRSRVRNERHTPRQLDLNQIALEVIQFVSPEVSQRGLAMRTDLSADLLAVEGNAIELQQVILNLIINGAQSMRAMTDRSCELWLRTSAQDGFVELAVEDQGVGLDENLADRIFEPFFTTKPQGTGMGLAINRTIIEAHGGHIWATPNDDRGATFHFRLPSLPEAMK